MEQTLFGDVITKQVEYCLFLEPTEASNTIVNRLKTRAVQNGIAARYAKRSETHITLLDFDRAEDDDLLLSVLRSFVETAQPLRLSGDGAEWWGNGTERHLVLPIKQTQELSAFLQGLKQMLPQVKKSAPHITIAYRVPSNELPRNLNVADFDVEEELVFDRIKLLKRPLGGDNYTEVEVLSFH